MGSVGAMWLGRAAADGRSRGGGGVERDDDGRAREGGRAAEQKCMCRCRRESAAAGRLLHLPRARAAAVISLAAAHSAHEPSLRRTSSRFRPDPSMSAQRTLLSSLRQHCHPQPRPVLPRVAGRAPAFSTQPPPALTPPPPGAQPAAAAAPPSSTGGWRAADYAKDPIAWAVLLGLAGVAGFGAYSYEFYEVRRRAPPSISGLSSSLAATPSR